MRIALHGQVLGHQPHRVDRAHAALGEGGRRGDLGEEPVAEEGSGVCVTDSCHGWVGPPFLSEWDGSNVWMTPPIAKQAAPAKVPQLTSWTSSRVRGRRARVRREPGEEEEDRAELVDGHDPPVEDAGPHPDVAVAHLEHRQPTRAEEAEAAEDVGEPDPPVGLPRGEALGERRDQADREEQGAHEQHDRTEPAALARPVAPPAQPVRPGAHAGLGGDQHDRDVAAEAEEEAPDEVGDVDRRERADAELGEGGTEGEQRAAEDEGHSGHEVDLAEPPGLRVAGAHARPRTGSRAPAVAG